MQKHPAPTGQPLSEDIHTAEEWEEIRNTFTNLYREEDMPLREIRETFAQRGFYATIPQYKRRIRRWKIDKNNKESDMVFAGQKLATRKLQGKETIFTIRGRVKPSHEVERYWKRRQVQPGRLSPVPSTPPDVRYSTPAPSSPGPLPFLDASLAPTKALASPHTRAVCDPSNHCTENRSGQTNWVRPILLPPLTSPGSLRDLELILRSTREHYEMCMDQDYSNVQHLISFENDSQTIIASTIYGYEASAQAALIRVQNTLSEILRNRDKNLLSTVMSSLTGFVARNLAQPIREFIGSLCRATVTTCSASHPFFVILQAMSRSLEMIIPFAEVMLHLGLDFLTVRMGAMGLETIYASSVLNNICSNKGDYTGALRQAERMYESYRNQSSMRKADNFWFMDSQIMVASLHAELGNYEEAARLVEEGLTFCETLTLGARDRDRVRLRFLCLQGNLRHFLGLSGAFEALEEALTIRLRWFAADDGVAMYIAQELQKMLDEQAVREYHV
ncbi:hypothetical protein EPUS_04014 [Endocarpon pusillum Z07020]|uniref:Clr5 domain-containing protein n=1 Tax=Endocarpon pusillum (strain Z07020 / HMAS-L-300199) TaxID=1263415 RepID=U1HK43_ENDPU|nr:uncharacterized protein EPUS_04014 [Endocarpon pusillum Z07020]ERF69309.1 hypothetical protein EPUS_04014 [Endocarpon pusillum Z07020]